MKKIIIALLAALLLLSACQPTPEAAVVVQKDFGQLTEKAKLDESHVPDLLLSESLKAPKTLHKALENKQGNVKVYIEADVTVPDAKGLPMIRVGHGSFTRDDIRRFADVLFNGAMPLDPNNKKYTKSMIQESIDRLIKMRESGDLDMKYESVEQVDADIAELMAKLETAPETLPAPAASDGTMTLYEGQATDENGISIAGETSRFYLLSASFDGYTRGISVSTAFSASLRDLESANHKSGVLSYWDNSTPAYTTKGMLRTDGSSLPEAAQGKLTISYDEAKALCDGFFAAAGMDGDFGVGAAFIVDDKGTGLVDGRWENGKYIEGLKNPAQNYAWQFYYARMADNIPIMLNTIAGGSNGSEFQISWNYEYICFTVDNNGIASVHWMSPIAVGDVVQKNAVLKSFPEIMGVFEKMVRVQYEPMLNTRYPDGNIEINVDDIELCLMRVREPNGDGTTGLLVPAWIFYGHNIATHSTGEQSFDFSGGIAYRWPQAPIVLFAINAIDASVINFTWGY